MIALMFITCACVIFDVSYELREALELVPFPTEEF